MGSDEIIPVSPEQVAADLQWLQKAHEAKEAPPLSETFTVLARLYQGAKISSLVPVLPYLLRLRNKPFSIEDHFPFEPMYDRLNLPKELLWKCGRQVAKSTSLAAQGSIQSACIPDFSTLFLTPLYEQIRRFSSNYVRKFIEESPIRDLLLRSETMSLEQNVLQKTFSNRSVMYFSFCFGGADRIRGLSVNKIAFDEVQDIDFEYLPEIQECTAAQDFSVLQYSGTPKTKENTIQQLWEKSSMAEWVIPCDCGYWNICCVDCDLDKMIQREGLVCAKCGALVNPRTGHWVHSFGNRVNDFRGYHVPQPILPMHYAKPHKWADLWNKKQNYSKTKFLNECLGESCDTGAKLITWAEIKDVCQLPWKNSFEEGLDKTQHYTYITMGVDWGGGAGGTVRKQKGQIIIEGGSESFTVVTIVGWRPDGTPDVLYVRRMPTDLSQYDEASQITQMYYRFRCYRFAHDFGGAGNAREAMMIQAGLPADHIMPIQYVGHAKHIIQYHPPGATNPRSYYALNKTLSLSLVCLLIKAKGVFLPSLDEEFEKIAADFLALIEDKHDSDTGSDLYRIIKHPRKSDDFCHSLNYALVAHWNAEGLYPDLASKFGINLSANQTDFANPDNPTWMDA